MMLFIGACCAECIVG